MASSKLKRADLWSLEEYSERRGDFRRQVIDHKKNRKVMLAEHIQLIFEDQLTIHYQIQEMLRIEKVFESAGIQEELDAYNPLIPDGDNFKCSMLIQYADVAERVVALQKLKGIEDKIYLKVADHGPLWAIADEDLERANDDKTSAVHFLRFQLDAEQVAALKSGASLSVGVEHEAYPCAEQLLGDEVRNALLADLV